MFIRNFSEGEIIEMKKENKDNFEARMLIPKDVIGNLQVGKITVKGPYNRYPGSAHAKWHQFYIVTKGKAQMYLAGKKYDIKENMVIQIPLNTNHYYKIDEGEELEYYFINQHLSK